MNCFKFLFVFVFIFSLQSVAAETKSYLYANDSFWDSHRYVVVDGTAYEISNWSMTVSELPEVMKSNAKAAEFAKQSVGAGIRATAWFWGALGTALVYSLTTPSPYYNSTASLTVILAGVFVGGYYFNQSQVNLWKAINSYNGIDVDKAPVIKSSWMILPSYQEGGLQAAFTYKF